MLLRLLLDINIGLVMTSFDMEFSQVKSETSYILVKMFYQKDEELEKTLGEKMP